MKRNIFITILTVWISIFLLGGCGTQDTANHVLDAIKNEDYSKAKQIYTDAINQVDNKDELNQAVAQSIKGYLDENYDDWKTDSNNEDSFNSLLQNVQEIGIYDSSLNNKIQNYEDKLAEVQDTSDDTADEQSTFEDDSTIDDSSTVEDESTTDQSSTIDENSTDEQNDVQPAATTDSIKVTGSRLNVNHGQYASVTINTTPGAEGTIEVDYNSGPSTAAGLFPQTANSSGDITWTWKVGTRTAHGTYPVIITINGTTTTETLTVY
ncbi:hypothetical protein RCG17_06745 [Neobacillus sp. PS3-12]|uniref:hypothetical protein n=1 Tax=Neobacillus sp. PS3-12 TaxID=3070677 RepID=UPI0027E17475|nr:hypothetical protein [Neobacillus sp. PS3-12]WML54339.1 hypothetical protein RCG17_06745 [Neobacillus sp. PS3-12]